MRLGCGLRHNVPGVVVGGGGVVVGGAKREKNTYVVHL